MNYWFILFLPLIASVIIALWTRTYPKLSAGIAVTSVLVSLVLTCQLALPQLLSGHLVAFEVSHAWISIHGLSLHFGFLFNTLTAVMLFIVLSIALLIFIYSIEYMHSDKGFSRYFAFLSFFTFSMVGVVISNNFLQLFIFWELVGASSYLLIGFWYEKTAAADAGKKAFMTNRVGDVGFLIGILLLWNWSAASGIDSLNFGVLATFLEHTSLPGESVLLTAVSLLIFCGVLGKSAQFPLHVWLPDAMEGPTPVSALIHAATMVAAGVFLLARTFFLFHHAPYSLEVIAYIGAFTAFLAATQALVQTDLKRVLAYSTLSQLGYMVMAVGLGSSAIAMFHLTTHAFFKALLFLGAGAVIHMTHEQDIRKLGGLFKTMPLTSICFLVGSLALCGLWPLSGFWSKDELLTLAYEHNRWLYVLSVATAFLTSFYITRVVVITFFGKARSKNHASDPGIWMTAPLVLLTLGAAGAGFLGVEKLLHQTYDLHVTWNWQVVIASTLVTITGIVLAAWLYLKNQSLVTTLREKSGFLYHLLNRHYYMDDFYDFLLFRIQAPFSKLCDQFERSIIVKRLVNGVGSLTCQLGHWTRQLQTGEIQNYTTIFLSGVVVLVYWLLVQGAS